MEKEIIKTEEEQKLDELLQRCEAKVSTKNLGIMEQIIHDRGVSAGYFGVYIEDISEMSSKNQILYLEGQIKGNSRRKKLANSGSESDKEKYAQTRRYYLRHLGGLKAKGVIVADTSTLLPVELKHFNEGYFTEESLRSGKTIDDVFEERRKYKKETADDVLEEKRSIHIRNLEI